MKIKKKNQHGWGQKNTYCTYMHANVVQNTHLRVENLFNGVLSDLHQHVADKQ